MLNILLDVGLPLGACPGDPPLWRDLLAPAGSSPKPVNSYTSGLSKSSATSGSFSCSFSRRQGATTRGDLFTGDWIFSGEEAFGGDPTLLAGGGLAAPFLSGSRTFSGPLRATFTFSGCTPPAFSGTSSFLAGVSVFF